MKKCRIRRCDHDNEWDIASGNSDALCNEDSRDPFCSICDKNCTCKFSNYPFFDENKYIYNEEEDVYYYNLSDEMRNSDRCKDCVYNDYVWVELDSQEERKHKLIELKRNGENLHIQS